MATRVTLQKSGVDSAENARLAVASLLEPADNLTNRGGVVPGTGAPLVLTGTGNLTATIGAGRAWIMGTSGATQGAYPVCVDAAATLTFASGSAANRTDLVVLKVQDDPYDASGQQTGLPAVVQGASGGGVPSAPASSIALYQVPVLAGASSITWANAVDVRPWAASLGGIVPTESSASPSTPYKSLTRARRDFSYTAAPGVLEIYDGGVWRPVVPDAYPRGEIGSIAVDATGPNATGTTPVLMTGCYFTVTLSTSRKYRIHFESQWRGSTTGLNIRGAAWYFPGSITPPSSNPSSISGAVEMVYQFGGENAATTTYPLAKSSRFTGPVNGSATFAYYYSNPTASGNVFADASPTELYLVDVSN